MIGKKCRVDECENIITVRGTLCCKHRSRIQRTRTTDPSKKAQHRFQPVKTSVGYFRVNKNGKRVLLHRWLLEQKIGRKLKRNEYTHHINGDKSDNRQENLELVNPTEHQHIHHLGKKRKKVNHCFT